MKDRSLSESLLAQYFILVKELCSLTDINDVASGLLDPII